MATIKISELATGGINLTDLIIKADPTGVATKNTIQALITLIESGVFKISNNLSEGNSATIRLNIDAAGLSVANTFTGANTFDLDIFVNGLYVGHGGGDIVSNVTLGGLQSNISGIGLTSMGQNSLSSNTLGESNTAFGTSSLESLVDDDRNSAFGDFSLANITFGDRNTSVGSSAGARITGGITSITNCTKSVFIGAGTLAKVDGGDNEIVIGALTTGNGSNTLTAGNVNITDNYFNGNIHSDSFVKSGGTSTQILMADGSSSESTNLSIEQVGEDVAIGDILYLKSDGKFWKSSNTSYALASGSLRIATEVILTDSVGLVASNNTKAVIPTTAIAIGAIAYMGSSGAIISESERDLLPIGSFSRRVGVVYNATTLYFNPIGDTYEI